MDILQISTSDRLGGAERVAWDLFRMYRAMGHQSRLAVGRKRSNDDGVIEIRHEDETRGLRSAFWKAHRLLQPYYSNSIGRRLCRLTHQFASPDGWADRVAGREDFHYPGTQTLISSAFVSADITHAHNLHGSYFDLRMLPRLSAARPFVLTLHDAWLLAGHCAHSMECERWRSGCGECPDLSIYPAVATDATDLNWRIKSDIYRQSRLFVATPCHWLMRKVEQSMLMHAIVERRVIPYGVDLTTFKPGDRAAARARLNIFQDAAVLLFAANGIRRNAFKDYETLRLAIGRLGSKSKVTRSIQFIAVGESGPAERIGDAVIEFRPFADDTATMAAYYQAADVYVHVAKADTFPCTILEALACGTPVAATAVGGIVEQVRSIAINQSPLEMQQDIAHWRGSPTGALAPAGDDEALAVAVDQLLADDALRHRCGEEATRDAAARFDLLRHARDYLNWYGEILEVRNNASPATMHKRRPVQDDRVPISAPHPASQLQIHS